MKKAYQSSQSRRTFIKNSGLIATGMGLQLSLPSFITKNENMYLDSIGLQVYTVRNQMAENAQATFKAIKDAGYVQVELGNTGSLDELVPMAKDLGLQVHSTFMNWSILTGRWDLRSEEEKVDYGVEQIVEKCEKHGLSEVVFGYMLPEERSTLADYQNIAEKLNGLGELCQKSGIQLSYHNHSFEFMPLEGSNGYEILIQELDPELVKFELDIFWASIGGFNPVELMSRLGDRIQLLHLKDKQAGTPDIYDETKVPVDAFKELGNGVINIEKVLNVAERIGVKYCMVEQDQSPHPIKSIGESHTYLEKI